jgi:hypothetical protein
VSLLDGIVIVVTAFDVIDIAVNIFISADVHSGRIGAGWQGQRVPTLIYNAHLIIVAVKGSVIMSVVAEDLEEFQATPFTIAIATGKHVTAAQA